ncbi:MAG: ABC transporter ATP-binding protein [Deltaproteobacteria bacterium]|nr:MAG: ABC transporter ATP-binding protein [Deltaproteobacteria bacterium]
MIEIKGLHKTFGEQKVLDGVALQIDKGRTTVILGGSGVGKSVLLKHIIGLLRPDRGEIRIEGLDITRLEGKDLNEMRKKFGMLFQEAALFDSMTVGANVAFPLREHTKLKEKEIKEIVAQKLEQVGLEGLEEKMPAELSGGMKRRVGLARALSLDPEIVLVDEPTSGLDPVMAEAIEELIIETQRRLGETFVVITHDIHTAFHIGHKIAMLHDGRIVEEGSPKAFRRSSNPVVQAFLARGEEKEV